MKTNSPTRHGRLAMRLLLLVPAALLLAGCVSAEIPSAPSPTTSGRATSTPVLPTETPEPVTPEPLPTDVTEPAIDPNILTAEVAYELCIDKSADSAMAFREDSTRDQFVNAGFGDSTVVDRGDGFFFILSDLEDYTAPAEIVSAGATECVVGGTVSEPLYPVYGTITREYGAELDPYMELDAQY